MTQEPAISPQVAIPKDRVAPLDPKLYDPTPEALVFLQDTVTSDEDELRARVEEVQNEWARGVLHDRRQLSAQSLSAEHMRSTPTRVSAAFTTLHCS